MLKYILTISCLLLTSMASQAGLISHYGYERENGSSIVKGGGLEWLMWDVTKGMTIHSALDEYAYAGWDLATNAQMATLFNAFQFGKTDWSDDGQLSQSMSSPWTADEESAHNAFIELFGSTYTTSNQTNECSVTLVHYCYSSDDPFAQSVAMFGSDIYSQGRFNLAIVIDDYTHVRDGIVDDGRFPHLARLTHAAYTLWSWEDGAGVALVRTFTPSPTPVNAPASLSLFAMGLVALSFRRKALHH